MSAKKKNNASKSKNTVDTANENQGEELDKKIKALEEQIELSKRESKEFEDNFLRAVAESENVKKRTAKDLDAAHKYALSGFTKDLIEVLENLYRSIDHVTEDQKENEVVSQVIQGVELTRDEFVKIFKKYGVERIAPEIGDKFDHNFHQAISQIKDESHDPNTVIQLTQAGYMLNERLIRPALVVVSA
jgi:molecular chaperone GrpE